MNLQETIRRILREVRVPRNERVELYKDDNIIVVVPLTHRALQKYAHRCLWCINDDKGEWEDYHKGKHAVIIQRNPKKPKIGITGNPTASEIFLLAKWDNNQSSFEDVCQMLDYEFRNDRTMSDYYVTISNDINNFATNIVYYSPENGVYDQEDNFLWNFNIEINDIPNVKPKVIEIMDDYLQENEEMNLQENIRRILREELSPRVRRRIDPDEMEKEFLESFDSAYDLTKKRKVLSRHFLDELISTIIIMMMEAFHWRFDSTLPEDEFWYDDIHAELENHYRDRITQMYNEIRGINKSIIREESNKDILIDGLYDPIYEENGIVLFKEPKHLKVYSKFGIKKSNVISGKEFNKKYVDFKNKKLHKVLYKDGMTLGGNLGEGKYWCSTEYCLSVYLGETHQSSEYSKYVKEVVDFKLGDDLKILVKKHISDDL